jgi:hypothetical protein
MIKRQSFLIFFLCGIYTYCQLPETLQKYYTNIDKAEYAITLGNMHEASDRYSQAFSDKKDPFFEDIYNSFLVNTELKDNVRSQQDYKRLKCLQYNFSNIQAFEFFENFQKNNKEFIESLTCDKDYKFNYKLRKTLDSLGKWDQMYRIGNTNNFNEDEIKKFQKTDSLNAVTLKKIIEKYGFPDEYLIGMNNSSLSAYFNYQAIIIHQQKMGKYKYVDFEPLLYKAVLEGKLRNKDFVALIEFAFVKKDYNYFPLTMLNDGCCLVNKSIYPETRNKDEKKIIDRVNENRKKLGLTTLSRNVLYKLFNDNNTKYKIEPFYKAILFLNREEEESLRQKSIKINFEDYFQYYNDKNNNGR